MGSGLLIPSYSQGSGHPGIGLRTGLVGLWKPLGPTGAALYDASGRPGHGALSGMDAATDWVATQYGYALEFDGGTQSVAGISLGDVLDGRPISCWALCKIDDFGSSFPRIIDRTYNGQFAFYGGAASGMGMAAICSGGPFDETDLGAPLSAGTWYSLVWTYDGAIVRAYIDGALVSDSYNPALGLLTAYNGETRIGNRSDGTRGWDGLIAAVALWNRVLQPAEPAELYANPQALVEPAGPVLLAAVPPAPYYYEHLLTGAG